MKKTLSRICIVVMLIAILAATVADPKNMTLGEFLFVVILFSAGASGYVITVETEPTDD